MIQVVKPKRRYRSPLRATQAAGTRSAILATARRQFISEGWGATTVAVIAKEAYVSTETIYSVFGSKRAILEQLIVSAVRGPDEDTPLIEQSALKRIETERNPTVQITLFAENIVEVLGRVAPLVAVARAAAETERDVAELYKSLHDGRRRNLSVFADALIRNGPLRGNMDRDTATDILWRLASPEMFMLVRDVEGASVAAFRSWLRDMLMRTLVADGSP